MCKSVNESEKGEGYYQLNVLFGKEVRCAGCNGKDGCDCGKE